MYKSVINKSFICQWPELKSLLKSTPLTKCLSKHGGISDCRCALRMYWQVMWEQTQSAVLGSQRAVSWVSWYSMCNLRPPPDRQVYLNELNYWFRPFFVQFVWTVFFKESKHRHQMSRLAIISATTVIVRVLTIYSTAQ